jgi:thioredoxin reductase (NADPH)
MDKIKHKTDVAIIGAGPVGLFAIFECGMLGLKAHVIDALDMIGGQCAALYPEKPIYDIPGFPKIMGADLINNLAEQAKPFNPTYHLDQQVVQLTQKNDLWIIETSKDTFIEAKAILIAAGVGAFGPNRPPLDGIEDFEGTSVFYLVKKRADFAGKTVVIAGGGDSAVDWANSLSTVASKVYLVHRRDKFRAAPESVRQLRDLAKQGLVEMVVPYQLHALHGDDGELSAIEVATLDGEIRMFEADVLLPFFGLAMNLGPISTWGLNLERNHITIDPSTCTTNQNGIYAIGDIADYNNKLKLILCGFSEAAMAAHAIYHYLHPNQILHFEYSTTKGVP